MMNKLVYVTESIARKIDPDIQRVNVAGAIIFKNDDNNENKTKLLIIQRAKDDHWPNFWEIPRGKVEPGESIVNGLKREVKEETNLDIDIIQYFNKFNYITMNHGIIDRVSTQYNFICKLKDNNQEVKLSHEHQNYKWISYDAEAELYLNHEIKNTVMMALNKLGQIKINNGYDYKKITPENIMESAEFLGTNF